MKEKHSYKGKEYRLALDSPLQAEIEAAGSLKQLFIDKGIDIDEQLHSKIKGAGGLARYMQGLNSNSLIKPGPYQAILELDLESYQLFAELNKARALVKELEEKFAIVSDKRNELMMAL